MTRDGPSGRELAVRSGAIAPPYTASSGLEAFAAEVGDRGPVTCVVTAATIVRVIWSAPSCLVMW